MTRVNAPDGSVVNFPDSMDPAAIEAVMRQNFPSSVVPAGTPFSAAGAGPTAPVAPSAAAALSFPEPPAAAPVAPPTPYEALKEERPGVARGLRWADAAMKGLVFDTVEGIADLHNMSMNNPSRLANFALDKMGSESRIPMIPNPVTPFVQRVEENLAGGLENLGVPRVPEIEDLPPYERWASRVLQYGAPALLTGGLGGLGAAVKGGAAVPRGLAAARPLRRVFEEGVSAVGSAGGSVYADENDIPGLNETAEQVLLPLLLGTALPAGGTLPINALDAATGATGNRTAAASLQRHASNPELAATNIEQAAQAAKVQGVNPPNALPASKDTKLQMLSQDLGKHRAVAADQIDADKTLTSQLTERANAMRAPESVNRTQPIRFAASSAPKGDKTAKIFLEYSPDKAVGRILNAKDPVKQMRQAKALFKGKPAAEEAFKANVTDWLLDNSLDADNNIDFAALQKTTRAHRNALGEFYPADKLNALDEMQTLAQTVGQRTKNTLGDSIDPNAKGGEKFLLEAVIRSKYGALKGGTILSLINRATDMGMGVIGQGKAQKAERFRKLLQASTSNPEVAAHMLRYKDDGLWNKKLSRLFAVAQADENAAAQAEQEKDSVD